MRSPNKPAQTALDASYIAIIATFPCVVCDATPVEIHEFEQGCWTASVPCCAECHRGAQGWHGTKARWKLRKMTMVKAINLTVARAVAAILNRGETPTMKRRAAPVREHKTNLSRPSKIVPRRVFEA